jgi:transcriptional regulator with XRE-family HTH domain
MVSDDVGKPSGGRVAPEQARAVLGRRLRALRVEKGMSLRKVADAAGLSPSFVGLVERGGTEIAISRLIRLADVCGGVVADLLADVQEPRFEYVPLDAALRAPVDVDGVEILYLATPSWSMQPFMVRLAAGARLGGLVHGTEEFVHCIEGTPALVVNGHTQLMAPGDTICIPRGAVHEYVGDRASSAVLLGAVHRRSGETRHLA